MQRRADCADSDTVLYFRIDVLRPKLNTPCNASLKEHHRRKKITRILLPTEGRGSTAIVVVRCSQNGKVKVKETD